MRQAGPGARGRSFGARRQHGRARVRAVSFRNHGHRPRRTPIRRPHQRHGIARRHQRDHLDDLPALGIDDHPDFFAGGIDRAHGVDGPLPHRATQRLEFGGTHHGGDLVRRQSRIGIDGAGIGRWRCASACPDTASAAIRPAQRVIFCFKIEFPRCGVPLFAAVDPPQRTRTQCSQARSITACLRMPQR